MMRFAIDHPGRIRGLVLAGSFASYRGNPVAAFAAALATAGRV